MRYLLLVMMVTLSHNSLAKTLTVFAASSMTNAVNEIAEEFEKQENIEIRTVFAGSSSLARQILTGAPADIFISANTRWMDYLQTKGAVEASNVHVVAHNELALITSKPLKHEQLEADSFDLSSSAQWRSLLKDNRLAIGQTDAVPVGIYTKQALESLGIWSDVRKQLAPVNNVRQVLALVDRQEAPLGVVYRSDVLASDGVTILAVFPASSHDSIDYPMANLNGSPESILFAQFVRSEKGQAILRHYGFITEGTLTR
ncbi:molybdenum ABC transporter periplasmic molybdenum-binding protein ModA [Vibrio maritimus]|uniref:Molybdenum ABC transporter periplasmic molybdenum-binding protein ModA n=1 Tax=Vibrio maritimus TaxID=990268 RepID=A0A090RVM0_9VIBR|nr:molybdenum ABC transporter periplasmic molybdenum-binding protein ModA [Vibrio maritimus]